MDLQFFKEDMNMIKRAEDLPQVEVHELRGGEGTLLKTLLGNSEETFGHASLFATFTYPPGASIGYHTHDTNMEYYYILSGELTLEENGVVSILKEGDVSVCRDGNGHSIKNHTDKEAKMLALIVEK